ncbi:gamma-soluble NSF attachment protein-like [Myxocyprinus asiaticus]|uniref:gamma-soluble NSF attachment protein-like n=1 Tax=Myxocyprinus asiaticus TaxID=70543 RepID=UPI002221341B|nr:gamma-soluble NSF attachment protein-like [Myxocyprinus asiaticus]
MAAQKINEAHEHIAKAEKCLKTSMTKWKPDYDGAASEMAKAAVAFKNAKQFEQAKDAYLKEAEYHTENKALFNAAKAYEQAGMMLKDMKKMPEAIQLIEKASIMYVENGTSGTAGIALDRAGKLIEPIDLEKAVDLYQKAASVFENEDRLRQAAELLGKASRLLVRLHRLDEAAVSLQKEKNMYKEIENYPTCFKKTIAQVLVHLHRGDFVAADKCVRESYSLPGFSGSEDCISMETLLAAYDEQDEDDLARVCNSPLLKYMDNDYAKLAISLKVPGGGGGKKKKTPVAPQGGSGAPLPAEEHDDYEGGLC